MTEEKKDEARRVLLKKAAALGLPVILATVRPRKVWAQAPGSTTATSGVASGQT